MSLYDVLMLCLLIHLTVGLTMCQMTKIHLPQNCWHGFWTSLFLLTLLWPVVLGFALATLVRNVIRDYRLDR